VENPNIEEKKKGTIGKRVVLLITLSRYVPLRGEGKG